MQGSYKSCKCRAGSSALEGCCIRGDQPPGSRTSGLLGLFFFFENQILQKKFFLKKYFFEFFFSSSYESWQTRPLPSKRVGNRKASSELGLPVALKRMLGGSFRKDSGMHKVKSSKSRQQQCGLHSL